LVQDGIVIVGKEEEAMQRRRSLIFLLCVIVVLISIGSSAQEIGQQGGDVFVPAPGPPPVTMPTVDPNSHHADDEGTLRFKSETVLVQVPAVVTDKSGAHVHSLSKDDFKILENGKQQRITAFEEITTSTARAATSQTAPGTFSNLMLDEQQPRAVTLIALDTINTPFLDQAYGRKELIKYLADHLESGQVLGLVVVGSKGVKVLSGLDSDPASLIAALKKASGEVSPMQAFGAEGQVVGSGDHPSQITGGTRPGEDPAEKLRQFIVNADALEGAYQQSRAIEDTMKAFLAIAWSLSGVPGRKSLIWATGGFPFPLDSPSSVPGGSESLLYERAMEALKNAQVSVYPVDVRGLVSSGGDITYGADGSANNVVGRSGLQSSTIDTLKTFAEMTGGRAFYNSNDLASGFKRAADDSSTYYLLGYYMNTRNSKPGWRKLQVEVQRKDFEVRARTGYFVTNATVDPDLTHKADIGFALSSPFDSTGIAVTVKWQGASPDGTKKKVAFALHLPATGLIDEADKNRFDVDFIAQASLNGAPVGSAGQTTKGTVPAAGLAKIKADGIFYRNALELPPGSYDVRFVVRNNLSGQIGSVTAPLTVN
jgi:VWFA-related protein